jgi:acetolactate synthase-1/2/3 large subunit
MPTGADILVNALSRRGVTHVFGMPGSHTTYVYDALHRQGKIKTILCRNEQAAAFAADGYARVTGRPGVVCTTAGPGATNALTGVAEAWADGVPILLIAGQVNSDRMHVECGRYHEIDLDALFAPCTKRHGTVRAVDEIPRMVDEAFVAMTTGRPRPAALFLPQDLAAAEVEFLSDPDDTPPPPSTDTALLPSIAPPSAPLGAAAAVLGAASRPVILAGGGALWSGAEAEVRAVARRLDCPVITTLNGKGLLDERDRYSLGHARSVRAKAALAHADAMLAVGCRFTEVMTEWGKMAVPARLVQIDVDPAQIGVNYPVAVGLVGDARTTLTALREALPEPTPGPGRGWGRLWDEARTVKVKQPEWLIDVLREQLPDDAVVFTDACEMAYRMMTDFPVYGPRRFFYPSNFIALGWGFPAAVGGAVGAPGRTVACVSGDGGFTMTAQELATAARYKLRVIAVIHNDSAYGAMKNLMQRRHGGRFIDADLNNPSFVELAAAYGVRGVSVHSVRKFTVELRSAVAFRGPTVIEVLDKWRQLRVPG